MTLLFFTINIYFIFILRHTPNSFEKKFKQSGPNRNLRGNNGKPGYKSKKNSMCSIIVHKENLQFSDDVASAGGAGV